MKNISFLSEIVQFLEVQFSMYLNRRVFIMRPFFYRQALYNTVDDVQGMALHTVFILNIWTSLLLTILALKFDYLGPVVQN